MQLPEDICLKSKIPKLHWRTKPTQKYWEFCLNIAKQTILMQLPEDVSLYKYLNGYASKVLENFLFFYPICFFKLSI